ncbi:PTS fructose transporter subunit IIABC [Mycolicibacterium brumae]|uniref:PTS lactose transporter subunit IIC n=1 Tax=Mycolicibacterium brumae TaxID=85968 RepID=A0A2G5PFV9_9MYCO|nr:fructose-specific PTS transporter subunit EIIC [Mycolicibacterium brumae]MCV7194415.1 PTS sugar transporter subunit IIA [Mycolicibacterium brumae]PIB77199.1 PTS lactose transporter subunit IIC [Mycolicibacterium brumae]RWA15434.1 PTS lactose transporter subunit IIC [Mycolicibacterium brumae DSM 44177]UWW10547.1 fructose-specific PTS transporter subunit EIIC [Mycolicibacterium brumae]
MTQPSPPVTTPDLVLLGVDAGADKEAVIARLAAQAAAAGRCDDPKGLAGAAAEREAKSATGLPGGIAIPHCRSPYVDVPTITFARLDPKVDFGAPDGPADLVFLIAAPDSGGAEHLKLLSSLARSLVRPDFVTSLREAATADDVVALIDSAVHPKPKPAAKPAETAQAAQAEIATPAEAKPAAVKPKRIVAITACPTGIAHTYMAADSLKLAAERAGVDFVVETQGSSGSTPIPPDVIASADAVIFATEVGVKDRGRFAGLPVIASGVKRAINEPDVMIAEAVAASDNPNAARVEGGGAAAASSSATQGSSDVGWGTRTRQILLTGVSYMIPFVAGGGLLIALGFLFAGYDIANAADGQSAQAYGMNSLGAHIAVTNTLTDLPAGGLMQYIGAVLFTVGQLSFMFLVPALAGYIAFAMADRPGIAPGFTAGAVAVFVGAGFIGGIVGGVIAGFVAKSIGRLEVPRWLRGLMPVVIIPLGASLVVGLTMFLLLGRPLAALTNALTEWLSGMSGSSVLILGVILGLMMCFDLGGPVNKAAYAFAAAGLSTTDVASMRIMAAVMAAGMVPPLAMALATAVRPKLFSEPERENGRAAWLLGASFISEGAIPFAAADPLRVIPSMMAGGAVTGALIMAFDVTSKAPHGGIFVFFAIGNLAWFIVALTAGTVVGAVAVIAAKQFLGKKSAEDAAAPVAA